MTQNAAKIAYVTILLFLLILLGCSDSSSTKADDKQDPSNEVVIEDHAENSVSEKSSDSKTNNSNASSSSQSQSSSQQAPTEVEELDNMILVEAQNEIVQLSDNMYSVLNYPFLMGVHEVTCGEYGAKCENDSLPITNITYFDAVLFANEKSKKEKYDTVYTYTNATFDSQKHCTNLENFKFLNDRDGYRLPTEAEWILVASKSWNLKYSWNSENSDNTTHSICSKKDPDSEFCDFAGNAMEWVNDWLYTPTDTALANFIGAARGNGLSERILKGGSYANSPQSINLFSKSDVYTVTSSTKADYVGFRLAFGRIPNANSLSDATKPEETSNIELINSDAVTSITGSFASKLVFRNDLSGNLVYVDYSDVSHTLFEIIDTLNAYHPDVSPNGLWVAFSTSIEGVKGNSSIYVRKLNPTGSDLVKLDVESASIPRWRVSKNGDTSIVYVSDAGSNKETSEWSLKSTWEVPFSNGNFGTPKKLFDGSFHGGISEDETLIVTGSKLLRARIAPDGKTVTESGYKDTIWYNGEQACNVSLVQDGTKRTAFLDFAGKTGKEFVGTSYSIHQRILIADKNGKLIQSIAAPNNYAFDHTEWSSNGQKSNIVATLTNDDGEHKKIVLVNAEDSSVTEIVQGDELWHPCLWVQKIAPVQDVIEVKDTLDRDSAGIYFVSGGTEIAVKWRYKMELLWKYRNSIDAIVLGSSRALHGVIPEKIKHASYAMNFANSNGTIYCSRYFLDSYVWNHIKNLKYIIMSIDIDRGFNTKANSFLEVSRFNYPGFVYDENHDYWKDSVPDELVRLTSESLGYWKFEPLLDSRGYEQLESNGWGEPKIWTDSLWMNTRESLYYDNFDVLKYILQSAMEHDVKVIGIIFPQNPEYKNTGAFAFHGIQRSKAPALIQELADLSKTYPNFTLMDENKMGDHDYTDDMAFDHNHLAHDGALQMTSRIDELLATLSP